MRPTERVNGEEARHAVLAGVLERYRAIFSDPAARPGGAPGPDPISQWAAAEYSEGPPLAAVVELTGPLAAEEVAALALGAVEELTQVHAAGAVHGDLNPSNLLISDGGVRLIHSGIAHTVDGATLTDLRGNPRTVAYLTPEQILGQPFDASADVFALGGVLAFAAVGVPAFGNDEPNAVLYRIVHEEAVLDAVPDALRGLVKACLSKDPAQRPSLQTLADRARGVFSDAVGTVGTVGTLPVGEQTATFEPVFDPIFEQATDPRLEPMSEAPSGAPFEAAPFDVPPFDAAQLEQMPYEQEPLEAAAYQTGSFETGPFDTGSFETGPFDTGSIDAGTFDTGSFDTGSFEPAPAEPLFDPALDASRASAFESMVDPVDEPTTTVVTFPSPFPSTDTTLTEVPLRDPFEPMPTRRHPRYEPLSALDPAAISEPTMTAEPIGLDGPPRRRRSRTASLAVLGTVVIVGVVAALVVRSMTHSNAPATAPAPSVPVMPTAPLPGTFLTGPGCPTTPWAMITQSVAADGGLVANAGGGAPDCGGAAVAFVKSGTTNPGASSYSWTFHLGWSARCTLSVFVANTAPSSGIATYQLFLPTDNAATPTATVKLNQGKTKGQWVSAPQLTGVALPGGSVQLRLTDAGAFTGDRFHVTASAVKAACSRVP
ncbi:MAG TPA: protein kinase [Actinocrinis sp.]|uniref:serine/threonine protein kinase n=1 Tax=Actinocrinis sp. TaxID=1920516 RepID=UPI002D66658A|nr:protein kinase [Actinocrinis sp.]HZU58200.1 protein kinase [Actinocrinis sp.]